MLKITHYRAISSLSATVEYAGGGTTITGLIEDLFQTCLPKAVSTFEISFEVVKFQKLSFCNRVIFTAVNLQINQYHS